jgi:hypothetical protein
MVTKKINHVSDLPEWFNLKNYEATEDFNTSQWFYPLTRRGVLKRGLELDLDLDPTYVRDTVGEAFSCILKEGFDRSALRREQLNNSYQWIADNGDFDHNVGFEKVFHERELIQSMYCSSAWVLGHTFEKHYGLNEEGLLNHAPKIIKHMKDNNLDVQKMVPIMVNLQGSDVDIKNQFSRFLEHARAYTGIENKKTHITVGDIEKLQKYSILPYIDLRLWSEINNITISAKTIIDALFFFDEDVQKVGEPFIAQTLKPFYDKVTSRAFISALGQYIEK